MELLAGEKDFLDAKTHLDEIQGRKPNDKDFFRIIGEFGGKLTVDEEDRLFVHMVRTQKPLMSDRDILALYQAKRSSLNTGQVCYEETVIFSPEQVTHVLYMFAFSETGDMYLEQTGKQLDRDPERSIITIADDAYTRVAFAKDGSINASITPLTEHHRYFYQPSMPLILANLFDEDRFLLPRTLGRDIIQLLSIQGRAFVLEDMEYVNGKNCIVLFSMLERFYLVPEYDYAMTRFESYRSVFLEEDKNKGILERRRIGREYIYESDLTDFVDCGNGIWVPTTVKNVRYDNGTRTSEIRINVKDVQLNEPLPKSFFADVIPENAMVADGIRGLVYRQSDSPSQEVAKSNRTWFLQYLSLTLGCILILLVVVVKYIKYLKRKQTA
ncbi:MAG: hypothetical protein FWG73_07775 [Planctomycetaceae bacterium]|nr:hypothetical protein [Planctomycetaceae bacterium]